MLCDVSTCPRVNQWLTFCFGIGVSVIVKRDLKGKNESQSSSLPPPSPGGMGREGAAEPLICNISILTPSVLLSRFAGKERE